MFINFFTEPLQYVFMRNALIELVLLSFLFGIIGSVVVIKNFAFIGDAISHGIFPGIVISFILKINIFIGAIAAAVITIFGISFTSKNQKISENTSSGILFTTMFAIGLILISTVDTFTQNLSELLLGNILAINNSDIFASVVTLVLVFSTLMLISKKFLAVAFDREYASSIGINVQFVEFVTNLIIALSIVTSVKAAGTLLVLAIMIIPAASSKLISKNILEMFFYSILISLISSVVGLYLSYYVEIAATSATIVVTNSVIFYIIFVYKNYLRVQE